MSIYKRRKSTRRLPALREQIHPLKFDPAEPFGPEFRTHVRLTGCGPLVKNGKSVARKTWLGHYGRIR
jgi:hypothetical protein